MSTHSNTSAPGSKISQVSELSRAFVDFKISKKASAKAVPIPEAKDIDIRNWHYALRSALNTAPMVSIFMGNTLVCLIPKPLLKVASISFETIFQDGKVTLPEGTELQGVTRLIDHMKNMAIARGKPHWLRNDLNIHDSLSICAAAKLLGMETYTDHVFKKTHSYFHTVEVPAYGDLEALAAFPDQFPRFYHIVVQKLAKLAREDLIEDPEDFEEYLVQNSDLRNAIVEANKKNTNWLHAEEARAQREKAAELEEKRTAIQVAQMSAKQSKLNAQDKAQWAKRKEQDAALSKSIKEKMAGPVDKRKFTPQERSFWGRNYGTRLPKGA